MKPSRRRSLKLWLQVAGFLAGLALLGWCARLALAPERTEQLERLAEAGGGDVGALVALSALSVVVNGLAFWCGLAPVRKLPVMEMISTNAIATFLSYMPFKAGLIARIAIHNRRHRVSLLMMGAWFAAVTLVLGAALGPILLVSLLMPSGDVLWQVSVVVAIALAAGAVVVVSRLFEGERGTRRVLWLANLVRLPYRDRLFASKFYAELHTGFSMLAHGPWVVLGAGLRLVDMVALGLRLAIVSELVGIDLTLAQAVTIAVVQFVLGAVSPSGQLGVREMGGAGLAQLMAIAATAEFATVALSVTAVEAVVNLAAASVGVAWLRPDRLLQSRLGAAPPEPAVGLAGEEAATSGRTGGGASA